MTDPQSQLTSGETFGARLVATAEAILLELIPARRFQWTLLPSSGKVHTLPGPKRASACSRVDLEDAVHAGAVVDEENQNALAKTPLSHQNLRLSLAGTGLHCKVAMVVSGWSALSFIGGWSSTVKPIELPSTQVLPVLRVELTSAF